MPLTDICNATYDDSRQRQLFKNIIYVGALAALLDMDAGAIAELIGEQYKGKEKLLKPNLNAMQMGRDYALAHLKCPIGLRVKRADAVGNKIFMEGNSATALGAVYGGATVCAWYPITPSSSVAEAFERYCKRLRVDPGDRQEQVRDRAGRGRARLDRHRHRRRLERRARLHRHLRPGHLADDGIHRPCLLRRDPGDHHRRAARRPLHRHAHAHAAGGHPLHRLRLARRHQACAAVPGRPERVLRVHRAGARPRRPAADAGVRDDRPRHRHEHAPVRSARVGRRQAPTTAARS